MKVRPATHAGSWYSSNAERLNDQIGRFLSTIGSTTNLGGGPAVPGNRVLIGPHAGYSFAGQTLTQTYQSWDSTNCERVIIMGPSHHVYYKDCIMLSPYDKYHTPFGDLEIDTVLRDELIQKDPKFFKKMTLEMDQDEHSFEMHMPFVYKMSNSTTAKPKVLPIMISHTNREFEQKLATYLQPYFNSPTTTFAISSDFCHWGSRFRYTAYTGSKDVTKLTKLSPYNNTSKLPIPIYESIEILDKLAMQIISSKDYTDFKDYIDITGNTICGERPIGVLLNLINSFEQSSGKSGVFNWLGYTQSSSVVEADDSSVSYASGYCVFN